FRDETGLDEADARDLFFEYVNSLSLNLKIIEDALNRADFKTVKSLAHQLKGSAGSMKFDRLAAMLVDFEEKAISGDIFECRNIYRTIKNMFE
ncbi:MAG TPA: Hpt domain-containing protein, partial [Candidatus Wallbacteria bacterium]|nr:Hpt domain-containing protein [Candidatus Wallbacteria bacterium]